MTSSPGVKAAPGHAGLTGAILAGGSSRRLGRDKATLKIGGKPLARWVAEALAPTVTNLWLVTNHPQAHLTLGRIKQSASPAVFRQMITEHADLSSDEFTCHQVILFKSDLKPSGAVYSKLKQTNLGMTNDE